MIIYIQAGEGPSVTLTSWTRIGTPPSPRRPQIVSLADTTIKLRLFPVTSDSGPITAYRLYMRDK